MTNRRIRFPSPPSVVGSLLLALLALLAVRHPHLQPTVQAQVSTSEPGAPIEILGPPSRELDGWRIRWSSVAGERYALQRWHSDSLGDPGDPAWIAVAEVDALSESTSAVDPTASSTRSRFYRVVLIPKGTGPDRDPPILADFRADLLGMTSNSLVRLSVTLSDPSGIQGVEFFRDNTLLGVGTGPGPVWFLEVPYPQVEGAQALRVLVRDGAGNLGTGTRAAPSVGEGRNLFTALDAEGRPISGAAVTLTPGVPLPRLDYRPAGGGGAGLEQGLVVRLTPGAEVTERQGRQVLRFSEAVFRFGRDSRFQFGIPTQEGAARRLGLQAPATRPQFDEETEDGNIRIVRAAPVELPLGPLTAADLEHVLGLPPGEGVPLVVFGQFRLRWHAGILEDEGIRGGRFHFDDLPLPFLSGDYPDLLIPLHSPDPLRLPYYGEFHLAEAAGLAPLVRVSPTDPAWLTLRADGSVAYSNRSEFSLPAGGKFRADTKFDPPEYRIQIFADGVQVPLLGSLAEFLPPDPGVCVTNATTATELDRGTHCLVAYDRAVYHLAASVAASAPVPTNVSLNVPALPPDDVDTALSILDAWSYAATTPFLNSLPLDALRDLIRNTAEAADASGDAASVIHHRRALARARAALHQDNLPASAETQAEIDSALTAAENAALALARDPNAIHSLETVRATLRALVETQELYAQSGRPQTAGLHEAFGRVIHQYLDAEFRALEVLPGQFTSPPTSPIAGMNRFVVFQTLRDLLETLANAALLGVDDAIEVPFAEAASQMALRLWTLLEAAMNEAEAAGDVPGFLFALEDALDFQALREMALFPDRPELAGIPRLNSPAFLAILARLNTLFLADLQRPYGERSLVNETVQLRRLIRILRGVPPTVTFDAEPFTRAHDRIVEKLHQAMGRLPGITSLSELLPLLEAGILAEALRIQFSLPPTWDWDGEQLPQLVTRLSEVGREQRGWSELHQAFLLLHTEAERLKASSDPQRRRVQLQQAVTVLLSARLVATQIWDNARAQRGLDSFLNTADLLLPGNIQVDKVAGAARLNVQTKHFTASFRGEMRMPKFQGRLGIANASVNGTGEFDLSAFGTFTFQNTTVTVPRRQPLHLSYRSTRGLAFSGEAMLALANGMSFAARLNLEDPRYGFLVEARDMRLGMAKQLALYRPTLNGPTLAAAGTQLRQAYIDYYTGLNTSIEALAAAAGSLPEIDGSTIGQPPEFEEPQLTLPFSQLNAVANSILLDVQTGINRSYAFVVPDLQAALETLRNDAALAAETFAAESAFLENQLQRLGQQRRMAAALQEAGNRSLLGNDDIEGLLEEARSGARQEAWLHGRFMQNHPPGDLPETVRHTQALLDLAALQAMLSADFSDLDGDGFPNESDRCPVDPSTTGQNHPDRDNDGVGDDCDVAPDDPSAPAPGPCRDYLALAGRPIQQAQALLACQVPKEYLALGLHPETGAIANPSVFHAFGADDLELRLHLLIHLEGERAAAGIESNAFGGAITTVQTRLLELKAAAIQEVPSTNPATRYDLALQMAEILSLNPNNPAAQTHRTTLEQALTSLAQLPDPELVKLEKRVLERKQRRDQRLQFAIQRELGLATSGDLELLDRARRRGWVGDTLILLEEVLADDTQQSQIYRERVDAYIRYRVQQLKQRLVDPEFLAGRLEEGEAIAKTLYDLTAWLARQPPSGDETLVEDLRVAWQDTTIRFVGVAEARKAWWLLRRYESVLHQAVRDYEGRLNTALIDALRQAFSASMLANGRIADALLALVDGVGVEQVLFKLPGDLRIRRAFGGLEYNRETEVVTGRFGGRVEFPELGQAFFAISNATVASDGSFSISASTGGPLPFGSLRASTSLEVAGNLGGLQSISGSGQLFVPLNMTTQVFGVNLGYNLVQKQLRFDSTGTGLDLRLSDDFVLFNGGVGFDLSLAEPAGALRFSGSAGMFAREKPLPTLVTRTNFHLMVTNAALRLALGPDQFSASLTNGTLLLPEFFRTSLCTTNRILTNYLTSTKGTNSVLTNFVQLASLGTTNTPPPGTYGPSISLTPTNPITLAVHFNPPSVAFSGELTFRDLGFRVPRFDTVELAVCRARLIFPTNQLPVLTNFNAAMQFPLPGQTNVVEVVDGAWSLDGFPTGTVRLRTDVDLFDLDGWRLSMLGRENLLCPSGTGITLARLTNGVPFLRLDAGVELAVPTSLFGDESGAGLSAASCGSLFMPFNQTPSLAVNTLTLSNRLVRLGGTNGVSLTNMVLRLDGLTNLFQLSPQRPFTAGLSGTVLIGPGSGLGLSNAVFRFEGSPLPRFTVSEVAVVQPGAVFGLNEHLPVVLDEGRIRFLRDDLPLPSLFALTNLATIVSGSVALPPGPKPVIGSRVKDLTLTFQPNGLPQFNLDALGFSIDLTAILGDDFPLALSGMVYVGGLSDPPNYLFSGKLAGNYKGNAVEGLAAIDACGLKGVCFGLAGSEISIPLPYGFVLTGAKGGVSFVNSGANPCDFATYLPIDPRTGRPLAGSRCDLQVPTNCPPSISMEEFRRGLPRPALLSETLDPPSVTMPAWPRHSGLALQDAAPTATEPFPCPGDCPPAAVNIFCMPHPDHALAGSPNTNRVVFKFSAIDENTLNLIGITPEFVASLVPNFTVNPRAVAIDLAASLRAFVSSITPRPPRGAPPAVQGTAQVIEQKLDEMALSFANAIHCATSEIPTNSADAAAHIYQTIRDVAWAGVACPEATVLLQGSVSYTGVSAFANLQGGVVLSSSGSAGVVGAVNVFGMPVGTARVFVNPTDENGNPAPSMCGEVRVGIGPLELGELGALMDCPGCLDRFVGAFATLGTLLGDVYVYEIMSRIAPSRADPRLSALDHLSRLDTPDLQAGFVGALFQSPPTDSRGRVAPAFIEFAASLADAYLPRFSMCGEVNPKLFGFSLTGGNRPMTASFYSGPKFIDGVQQTRYLLFAEYGFSPSQLMASSLLSLAGGAGAIAGLFAPAIDEATASTTLELPPIGDLIRDGFEKPPLQIAEERLDAFLSDAVTTFTYRLAPLGMELGRASGRILMPSLAHHPRGPTPRTPPLQRNQGLPSGLDVLLAALGDKDQTNAVNRLGDGTWKGEGDQDFAQIFAGSAFAGAVAGKGLSLRDDYFPHGGFLGAGTMDFPTLLAQPLPPSLATALDARASTAARLTAVQDFVFNHLLATERVGELAFYLPAPNPPVAQFPTTPREFAEVFRGFRPDNPQDFRTFYPLEAAFLSGWLDTPILGVPTVRSRVAWEPSAGVFRMEANVPANSWFNRLVGSARFVVDLRNNPATPQPLGIALLPLSNQVARLRPNTPNLNRDLDLLSTSLPRLLADTLPKAAAELSANRVRIPVPTYVPTAPLTPAQTVATIDDALLALYSPYYGAGNPTGSNPLNLARRDGGFALRGDFNFLNGLVAVENVEFSVTPNPDSLGLPTLQASMMTGNLQIFGLSLGPPVRRPASLQSTQPASAGAGPVIQFESSGSRVRLEAAGSLPRLDLGPALALTPLEGPAIGATALFETANATLPQGSLAVSPAKVVSPLFAPGVTLRIHGNTSTAPFTFSTTAPWSAQVTLEGTAPLELVSQGVPALRILPSQLQSAGISRNAQGAVSLNLLLRSGITLTAFPGQTYQQNFVLGAASTLTVNATGTFSLSSSLGSAISMSGLPISTLAAGGSMTLTQAGLTLTGTASGGVLSQVIPAARVTAVLTIAPSTGVLLSGTASIQPISDDPFRIESSNGGTLSASLVNGGLRFSGARLRATGVLGTTVSLPPFTLPADGSLTLNLTPPDLNVAGIPCTAVSFTLRRQNGALSLNPFQARLAVPGFNQTLNGSVNSAGTIQLDYAGTLTLGGFVASNGGLHLSNTGLGAEGAFLLRFANTTFGSVGFSGSISSSGSYSLPRTEGSLTLGGFNIPSPALVLTAQGVTGSAQLPFGALNVPLNGLSITAANGLTFNQHDTTRDSGWVRFLNAPNGDGGDIYARLRGTVSFKPNNGTTFTTSLTYAWAPWLVVCDLAGNCELPPASINAVAAPPRISGSGSIGSSGLFTVTIQPAFGGLTTFQFNLW